MLRDVIIGFDFAPLSREDQVLLLCNTGLTAH